MRTFLTLLIMALLLPLGGAEAQTTFKRCFSAKEIEVEQLVRHGIFMREAAKNCEKTTPGVGKSWSEFDSKFAAKLKSQTDRRTKIFQREFKDRELQVRTYYDGRLVTYHRNESVTAAYCENIERMLGDLTKKGWGAFAKQAKLVQNEVQLDIKQCP